MNIMERNQGLWRLDVHKSIYGKDAYQYCIQYLGRQHFKHENKYYTRQHMKWLTAIRTGHDGFKHYQSLLNKSTSNICTLCNMNKQQDFLHLIAECNNPTLTSYQDTLNILIDCLYSEYFITNTADNQEFERKLISELPWKTNIGMYVFPHMSAEYCDIRFDILNEVIDYYLFTKTLAKQMESLQN